VSLSQNNMNIDCLKILMFTLWQSAKSKRLLPLCSKYIKLSNIISEHGTILDFFFLFCETFLSTRFPCVWCSLVNTIYNWHFKSSPERSAYFWATSRSCCLFIILFESINRPTCLFHQGSSSGPSCLKSGPSCLGPSCPVSIHSYWS
jgi:hypothetical protein